MGKEEKKYPKVVVGAFIFNKNNELLLVKAPHWQNKYSCPGGKIELKETMKKALAREIKEETNLEVGNIEFIGISEDVNLGDKYDSPYKHLIFIDFKAIAKNEEKIKLNKEGTDFSWKTIGEWLKLENNKFAPKILEVLKKLEEREENKDYKNRYLRALADYENLKKNTLKEKEDWIKFANANLITELIPILNNFKISLFHIPPKDKDSPWVEGMIYIQKQFQNVLERQGLEEIKTIGEKFNPDFHEAVSGKDGVNLEEKNKFKEGEIIKEVAPGYKFQGKVIIPAKVIVK